MKRKEISNRLKKYHFEFRHITVILFILVVFQIIFSLVQKSSLENFLEKTQKWYQKESAERIANLSTISLELLMENILNTDNINYEAQTKTIESFNIIFSQHLLEKHVQLSGLIVLHKGKPVVINDGKVLYEYLTESIDDNLEVRNDFEQAVKIFAENQKILKDQEQIFSLQSPEQTFHVLVPLVPHGEFLGVFYMKNTPNFSFITQDVLSGYNEVAIVYSVLILFGLLAMYLISSYSVKQRDHAQKLYFEEQEEHLKDSIMHEKESLFTKRIYHTHHKAEKVMGFIKEDLRGLTDDNMEEVKERVIKYSNFISRVIYDMKWYDPPIHTIRNSMFSTDVNEVIEFLVKYLFLRISSFTEIFEFKLNLDENFPKVAINEFVIWEILEPLIQNSIDHGNLEKLLITISTMFDKNNNISTITIKDNGIGIDQNLISENENGVKKIFLENISTKSSGNQNRGYGCYIAHQIATQRCGWKLDINNVEEGGCEIKITY